jgi:hypothetical protein
MRAVIASMMGVLGLGFGGVLADVSTGGIQRAIIAVCSAVTAVAATILAHRMNSLRELRKDAVSLEDSLRRRDAAIKERDALLEVERQHGIAAGSKIEDLQKAVAGLQERTDLAPVIQWMQSHEANATKRGIAAQQVLERIADGMSATNLNLARLLDRQNKSESDHRPE